VVVAAGPHLHKALLAVNLQPQLLRVLLPVVYVADAPLLEGHGVNRSPVARITAGNNRCT
jgi:hypothetical protein